VSLTVDLVEMSRRGLNYLTKNPQPDGTDYLLYFGGKIPEKGLPHFERCPWDCGDGTGRFLEAIEYSRRVTGFTGARDVEEGLLRNLYSFFKDDGISYCLDRPWSRFEADTWHQRGSLLALAQVYEKTGDSKAKAQMDKLLDALWKNALRKDGYMFLFYTWRDGKWLTEGPASEHSYMLPEALVRWHEASGSQKAFDLAVEIAKGCVYSKHRHFNEDGSWVFRGTQADLDKAARADFLQEDEGFKIEPEKAYLATAGHVHSRTLAIWGLILVGRRIGDKKMIDVGRNAFEYLAKHWGSSFGWFAENAVIAGQEVSEMCCLADIIGALTELADLGYTKYWNNIERYARNHLVEAQFENGPEILGVIKDNLKEKPPVVTDDSRSYKNALERLDGGFSGPIYPDDMFSYYFKSRYNPTGKRTLDISGCCSPSGSKSVYLVWNRIFDVVEDGLRVNMNFSKSDENAEVKSYRDDEGRIEVTPRKKTGNVWVKLPEWEDGKSVTVKVADQPRKFTVEDGYVKCVDVKPGQTVTVEYNLPTKKTRETVGGIAYDVAWKGDTITSLKNTTDYVPLLPRYQRG